MGIELQISLTQLSDYLGILIPLWLMLYLLARGYSNPLTLRTALVLLAITVYFSQAFSNTFLGHLSTNPIAAFAVVIALAAGYDLSYNLLPEHLRKKIRPASIAILFFAIIAATTLIMSSSSVPAPKTLDFYVLSRSPHFLVDVFDVVAALAILYNIRMLMSSKLELLHSTFYAFVLFAVGTIVLSFFSVLFQLTVPRFITNFMMLASMVFLGYSVARYQSLVDSRISIRDFPVSAISVTFLALVYIYAASRWDLPPNTTALLGVLAVATHSAYDVVRESLNRYYLHREQLLRRELRQLSRNELPKALHASLRRALAILCHNLSATSGFIALKEDDQMLVQTSYHAISVGESITVTESAEEELFQPSGDLSKQFKWLRWIFAGSQPIGLVGLGARTELRTYTESDLDWLEDVADQIGIMLHTFYLTQGQGQAAQSDAPTDGKLFSTVAILPDAEVVKTVEEGFRYLNDYIKLGDSSLSNILAIEGETHIERGKAVQKKLIGTLETLRPSGEPPKEPYPREWYSFTILHDAYVQEVPDQEIMAKLYISEGTFYRTRRKALRGISRALMESETVT